MMGWAGVGSWRSECDLLRALVERRFLPTRHLATSSLDSSAERIRGRSGRTIYRFYVRPHGDGSHHSARFRISNRWRSGAFYKQRKQPAGVAFFVTNCS